MGRRERHSADGILDATRELVLSHGARATTLDRLVEASGAPKVSIYHRFGTFDELLATLRLRAARRSQAAFLAAPTIDDATEAAVAAALSLVDFAVEAPRDAALRPQCGPEDLVVGVTGELRAELTAVNAAGEGGDRGGRAPDRRYRPVCDRQDGVRGRRSAARGAGRNLLVGSPLPAGLRDLVEAAVRAALAAPVR